ncbi:chaplin [Streptomyces sp. NPDC058964]|uniref:chaplin n=1 Tax=Streptomyces sp. NPDC058964 TaxID=3346681 RepID=UPI0036A3D474
MVAAAAATGIVSLCGGAALADTNANGAAKDSPGVASGNTVQVPVHVPVNVCGNSVDVVGALNPAFGNSCANASGSGASGTNGSSGASASGVSQGSPGVASGNTAQVPVHVPVNACGNSVDVVGLLNPAAGNSCANGSGSGSSSTAGSSASGTATDSPGVGSGNTAQVPVDVPLNVCGDAVDVVGLLNPAYGNGCGNDTTPPVTPPRTNTPPSTPPTTTTPPRTNRPPSPPTTTTPPRTVTPPSTPPGSGDHQASPPQLAHTGTEAMLATSAVSAALLAGGTILYRRGPPTTRR